MGELRLVSALLERACFVGISGGIIVLADACSTQLGIVLDCRRSTTNRQQRIAWEIVNQIVLRLFQPTLQEAPMRYPVSPAASNLWVGVVA